MLVKVLMFKFLFEFMCHWAPTCGIDACGRYWIKLSVLREKYHVNTLCWRNMVDKYKSTATIVNRPPLYVYKVCSIVWMSLLWLCRLLAIRFFILLTTSIIVRSILRAALCGVWHAGGRAKIFRPIAEFLDTMMKSKANKGQIRKIINKTIASKWG